MEIKDLVTLIVSTATALLAALMSSSLINKFIEKRQKLVIIAHAENAIDGRSQVWRIQLSANKQIQSSDIITCFPGRPGGRIVNFTTLGELSSGSRIRLNQRGHLECDVSYMASGSKLAVNCRFDLPDVPQFSTNEKSLRLSLDRVVRTSVDPRRFLLVAQWRTLWITGVILIVALIAITRLVVLGLKRDDTNSPILEVQTKPINSHVSKF